MTVYARGYRPYEGGYGAPPPAFAIAREGIVRIWRTKAFKRIGSLYLLWFVICAFMLYLALGMGVGMFGKLTRLASTPEMYTVLVLNEVLRLFYLGMSYVTVLLCIFVGSGLVADDLSTGALPLYLVRPLRAVDYVLGKALILPMILLGTLFAPGLSLYLLCGFWQPPGQSWAFLGAHIEIPARLIEHLLLASAAYTGLSLLLSSRTRRRASAAVLSATVIFGGVVLQSAGQERYVGGVLGDALRLLGLPLDTRVAFVQAAARAPWVNTEYLPPMASVRLLACALLAAGLFFAWRRACTVEITS